MTIPTDAIADPPPPAVARGGVRATLFGPATLAILDQAIISGARFAASVVVGRVCGKDALGVYYLAMSVFVVLEGIQSRIIRAPFTVHAPHRRGRALRIYAGSALLHHSVLTVISVVGILAFSAVGTLFDVSSGEQSVLLLLAVMIVPLLGREFVRSIALAHLEIRTLLSVDVAVAAIQLGGLVTLAMTDELTVSRAILIMGLGCAAGCLGWGVAKRRAMTIRPSHALIHWRRNWRFSRWALISYLLGATSPVLVAWILAATHGSSATGHFAACTSIVGLAYVVVGGLTNLAVPRAVRALAEGGASQVRTTMTATALMLGTPAALFTVFAWFGADPLAVWLYGEEFAKSRAAVTVLGLWMLANAIGVAAGSSLWAIRQPRANLPADVVAFTITAILAVSLVAPFDVLGVASAMALGISCASATRWITASRRIAALPTRIGNPS